MTITTITITAITTAQVFSVWNPAGLCATSITFYRPDECASEAMINGGNLAGNEEAHGKHLPNYVFMSADGGADEYPWLA